MFLALERIAAAFALGYVVLFACLLAFTTDGPDPTLPVAEEKARAASESAAMRASALLGFGATLAFTGFAVCLAIMLAKRGDHLGAALTAAAGGVTAAIDAVSAAGLVVAVEAADRDFSADVFAAFGDLHTAALLLELAPLGCVLLLAWRAKLGRLVSWLGLIVGIGCIIGTGAVMSEEFDRGPLGIGVVIWFIGLPLWLIVTSVVLIRRSGRSTTALMQTPEAP